MIHISPISAFQDNYIWCIHTQDYCVVVDPGDAAPVLRFLEDHNLTLTGILITHHHHDHVGGVKLLTEKFDDLPVWGAKQSKVEAINRRVTQGDIVHLPQLDCSLRVLAVPGHTLDHIAFYSEIGLFCGDTLFSAGCGRLFEGSPQQMFDSLNLLSALPGRTPVYCTHEYTLANLKFALEVEPSNQALIDYAKWATETRQQNQPTLPTTIEQQQAINPFLRTSESEVISQVKSHANINTSQPEIIFAELRRWKDVY